MLPKRVVIVPYKMYSGAAKALTQALRDALNIPVLKVSTASTKYQPRWTDYVINWGCSKEWPWINTTEKNGNQRCVNKLAFFEVIDAHNQVFKDKFVNIPEWTTDPKKVSEWIDTQGLTVVARKLLTGHSGEGIVLMGGEHTKVITHAPLYVQYKKKRHEYRVHFFKVGQNKFEIIDVTQKKKRKGFENVDTKIRNHKNGWVYAREDVTEPQDLRTQALAAAFASDLDFGAVDLIWNEHENKCYVLEVNTAPGLTGTTLSAYVNAFVKDITK
jgi:glutathione synthase/RimK-type ligase-like ATP-grasp enzyme